MEEKQTYRLTQYSHGAGCGCKIAPAVLDEILKENNPSATFPNLIVGNSERDDAAVMDIGNNQGIISTTDFFMPVVDDASDFGRISSANAISDIYAMGGRPIMAIAILGWPVDKLPTYVANQVLEGARAVCQSIGIPLAGGHSIDSPEPIFGLAVTGQVALDQLKKNGNASPGSSIYLTKGLGVGILTTAEKKGLLKAEHKDLAKDSMIQLNTFGAIAATLDYVEGMTDVTGFGLGGHLYEMCQASKASARITFEDLPVLDEAVYGYIEQGCSPGGTARNFNSYGTNLSPLSDVAKSLICDPQTSGGLLITVSTGHESEFEAVLKNQGQTATRIGEIIPSQHPVIEVQ